MYNVRTEVREIQPLTEHVEKIKAEMSNLKREVNRLEEEVKSLNVFLACEGPLLPELKACPFSGQSTRSLLKEIVTIDECR
jgi:wobble nucleotide-excising tRNase